MTCNTTIGILIGKRDSHDSVLSVGYCKNQTSRLVRSFCNIVVKISPKIGEITDLVKLHLLRSLNYMYSEMFEW